MTATGQPVWCDLSSFRLGAVQDFYSALLGWSWHGTSQSDGSPYLIASIGSDPVAGLFEMPNRFQRLNLPSFWMVYISVEDVAATVVKAREWGATVELEPCDFGDGSRIALIRDPLGAGFTVYEGGQMSPCLRPDRPGGVASVALHVSDPAVVRPFYAALFGWRFVARPFQSGMDQILSRNGDPVAALFHLTDAERDGFEFWGVRFVHNDPARAVHRIPEMGGSLYPAPVLLGREVIWAADPDGAAFFLVRPDAENQRP